MNQHYYDVMYAWLFADSCKPREKYINLTGDRYIRVSFSSTKELFTSRLHITHGQISPVQVSAQHSGHLLCEQQYSYCWPRASASNEEICESLAAKFATTATALIGHTLSTTIIYALESEILLYREKENSLQNWSEGASVGT